MKKFISVFLIVLLTLSFFCGGVAYEENKIYALTDEVGKYLFETVKIPVVGSVGGEWAVIGLARSDLDIPASYFENYYNIVAQYVKEREGILHNKKYTEYSRVILALTAIGKNPSDVSGYNLLIPLGDYKNTIRQGVNGAIWALIALDSKNYEIPENNQAEIQATREMYINHILEKQTSDGGWALNGNTADPDITGMALQALSKYQNNEKVKAATEKALNCLSEMQQENGGFSSYETENSESCVQVIVALCEMGISVDDNRFVKKGKNLLDNLFSFYNEEKGFKHTHSNGTNQMATEQCFYALVSLKRLNENKNSLYNMRDVVLNTDVYITEELPDKNTDIRKMNIKISGKTFLDINTHKYKKEIEELASREIINGKTENSFEPESTMTRAEFATIITRGLGLPQKNCGTFKDVSENDWFYSYVGTAYSYGIIKGISENKFNPNGTITREEAAVMIERAAKLAGADTEITTSAARDILAQFFDYVKAADWSRNSLAFCYSEGILDDSVMDIKPKEKVTRAEIASMLYNMLFISKLL